MLAALALNGIPLQRKRHERGAGGRCATQESQAHGSDMEDVPCENWQQRDRSAQQHGKQVQGNGAQDDGAIAYKTYPFGHALPALAEVSLGMVHPATAET